MPRIVITPCGTSFKETALCWTDLPQPLNAQMNWKDVRDEWKYFSKARGLLSDIWERPGVTAADIAERFDHQAWELPQLRRLPAELASLKLINRKLGGPTNPTPLGDNDLIYLLHGLREPRPAEVLELLIPKLGWGDAGKPKAVAKPFGELDATQPSDFAAAMKRAVEWLTKLPADVDRIYNLTGGYKGAAILLGIHAYYDAELLGSEHVQTYYLFEDSGSILELRRDPQNRPALVSPVAR